MFVRCMVVTILILLCLFMVLGVCWFGHKMFSCLSVVVWILFCLWLVVSDVDLCFIYVC